VRRGEIWWASLPEPVGAGPGLRRPVLIVSANSFNASAIRTVIAAVVTSNLKLANAPGNVRIRAKGSGLSQPSVVNVSQLVTVDKTLLTERVGRIDLRSLAEVDRGLRTVLAIELRSGD